MIDEPGKFDTIDYEKCRKALMNQLASILGANDVPLTYVVCPDKKTDESQLEGKSFLARTILQNPVEGITFEADSCNFRQLIVEATSVTKKEVFLLSVEWFECGCSDMKILTKFFEGTGENNWRKVVTEAALKHLEYRSKPVMKYTMFVSKLHGILKLFRYCGKKN